MGLHIQPSVAYADVDAGGSTEAQREFLEALSTDDSRRQDRQSSKQPPIANAFALGYTYHDVLDADHEGVDGNAASIPGKFLTRSRYSSSPLHIPTLRSLALIYTPTTTTSHTPDDPEHSYSNTSGLVAAMVLVTAASRLGAATQGIACFIRCGMQGQNGRSYAELEGQRARWT